METDSQGTLFWQIKSMQRFIDLVASLGEVLLRTSNANDRQRQAVEALVYAARVHQKAIVGNDGREIIRSHCDLTVCMWDVIDEFKETDDE